MNICVKDTIQTLRCISPKYLENTYRELFEK